MPEINERSVGTLLDECYPADVEDANMEDLVAAAKILVNSELEVGELPSRPYLQRNEMAAVFVRLWVQSHEDLGEQSEDEYEELIEQFFAEEETEETEETEGEMAEVEGEEAEAEDVEEDEEEEAEASA